MTTVIVSYSHDPPLDDAAVAAVTAKLRRCIEVREVKWVTSYLSLDGATMFAVFEADNAELVVMAHGMSGTRYDRCVPVRTL